MPESAVASRKQELALGVAAAQAADGADVVNVDDDRCQQQQQQHARKRKRWQQQQQQQLLSSHPVLMDIKQQLQLPVKPRDIRCTLFSGCNILFMPIAAVHSSNTAAAAEVGLSLCDYSRSSSSGTGDDVAAAAAADAAAAAAAPQLLLTAEAHDAAALAAMWTDALAEQQLRDARLAVLLHGGEVAETYNADVTHILLWPAGQTRNAALRGWLLQRSAGADRHARASGQQGGGVVEPSGERAVGQQQQKQQHQEQQQHQHQEQQHQEQQQQQQQPVVFFPDTLQELLCLEQKQRVMATQLVHSLAAAAAAAAAAACKDIAAAAAAASTDVAPAAAVMATAAQPQAHVAIGPARIVPAWRRRAAQGNVLPSPPPTAAAAAPASTACNDAGISLPTVAGAPALWRFRIGF
jgi:hypothetical protein